MRNANLVGGDIAGGIDDLRQFFTRPTRSLYSTPAEGVYICSCPTPPGVGVHGMWATMPPAARSAKFSTLFDPDSQAITREIT